MGEWITVYMQMYSSNELLKYMLVSVPVSKAVIGYIEPVTSLPDGPARSQRLHAVMKEVKCSEWDIQQQ